MVNRADEISIVSEGEMQFSIQEKAPHLPYIEPTKARQYSYFVIPKMLICDPAFANIDCAAKLIYSLMLNRLSLSAENPDRYTDEQNRLYIIYPIEEISQTMQISKPTVVKMVKQLEKAGLIIKKRQGQGKPTLIYVLDFTAAIISEENPKQTNTSQGDQTPEKLKKLTSRSKEVEIQEIKKIECSKNDFSNLDRSNFLPSERPLYQDGEKKKSAISTMKYKSVEASLADNAINQLIDEVRNQIDYDILSERHGEEIARAVLSLIVTALARDGPVYLGRNLYPENLMKQRFRALTYEDVDFALKKLYETPGVRNQTAYLTTLLFNSPGCSDLEATAMYLQDQEKMNREKNRNQFRFF